MISMIMKIKAPKMLRPITSDWRRLMDCSACKASSGPPSRTSKREVGEGVVVVGKGGCRDGATVLGDTVGVAVLEGGRLGAMVLEVGGGAGLRST